MTVSDPNFSNLRIIQIQEDEYVFPYHHIPSADSGSFSECRVWNSGYIYIGVVRFLLAQLDILPFSSLLDIGCGDGKFLCEIRKRFPDKRLMGVDTSARAIRFADAFQPEIPHVCGDIAGNVLGDDRFDVITLCETLEHIPPAELGRFLQAVRDRLQHDGRFLITVPTTNVPVSEKHFQHFTLESLQETLEPSFRIETHQYLNRRSRGNRLIARLLANRLFILNEPRLCWWLLRWYERHYLLADPSCEVSLYAACRACR